MPWGAATAYLETSRQNPGGRTVREEIPVAAAVTECLPEHDRPVG